MHNEVLEKYIKNEKILYLYELGLQVYGLFSNIEDRDFVMICSDDYVPDGFSSDCNCGIFTFTEKNEFGEYHYQMYPMKKWFEEVLNCSMIAWECACLPKKYIYKEHVKLLLQTDSLKLRKIYESEFSDTYHSAINEILLGNTLSGQKTLWFIVKYVIFANQIIENHKIVNFKEAYEPYKTIVDGQLTDIHDIEYTFNKEFCPHLDRFKQYTDGIYMKSKTLKFINRN